VQLVGLDAVLFVEPPVSGTYVQKRFNAAEQLPQDDGLYDPLPQRHSTKVVAFSAKPNGYTGTMRFANRLPVAITLPTLNPKRGKPSSNKSRPNRFS